MESFKSFRVCVTGAAGRIAYSIYDRICAGFVFGPDVYIELVLFDIPKCEKVLQGLNLEIQDCGYDLLTSVKISTKPDDAFKGVDIVVFLGGMPRGPGMTRRALLKINAGIYKEQGTALNKFAKNTCHVVVIANPANTMCCVLQNLCPNIPASNFTALTRLDQNRARFQLAAKLSCKPGDIQNMIIWGNHSPTMFPNFEEAEFNQEKVTKIVNDEKYFKEEFLMRVSKRGSEIIKVKGFSSVFPAGKALCDHLHDWYLGTNGARTSMVVCSDGSCYGVEKGIFCSFPVICNGNFEYQVDKSVQLSEYGQSKLMASQNELLEERKEALTTVQPKL